MVVCFKRQSLHMYGIHQHIVLFVGNYTCNMTTEDGMVSMYSCHSQYKLHSLIESDVVAPAGTRVSTTHIS